MRGRRGARWPDLGDARCTAAIGPARRGRLIRHGRRSARRAIASDGVTAPGRSGDEGAGDRCERRLSVRGARRGAISRRRSRAGVHHGGDRRRLRRRHRRRAGRPRAPDRPARAARRRHGGRHRSAAITEWVAGHGDRSRGARAARQGRRARGAAPGARRVGGAERRARFDDIGLPPRWWRRLQQGADRRRAGERYRWRVQL